MGKLAIPFWWCALDMIPYSFHTTRSLPRCAEVRSTIPVRWLGYQGGAGGRPPAWHTVCSEIRAWQSQDKRFESSPHLLYRHGEMAVGKLHHRSSLPDGRGGSWIIGEVTDDR